MIASLCVAMSWAFILLKEKNTSPPWTSCNLQKLSHRLHRMKSSGRGRGGVGRLAWNLIQVGCSSHIWHKEAIWKQ